MGRTLVLNGNRIDLDAVRGVLDGSITRLQLAATAVRAVERSHRVVERIVEERRPVYGISTGYGRLQDIAVPPETLLERQVNLLRSHAAGVGAPLPAHIVRLIMVLRANTLARGHSGVAPPTLRKLMQLFNKGVIPVVPEKGSVGASGDLAPLSHLALVLLGEGNAWYRGHRTSGARALKNAGIRPVKLGPKDALSLINGTQVTNAIGLAALLSAHDLIRSADIATAMTHESLRGSLRPYDKRVHEVRPHPGQAATAANLRRLLRGSQVPSSHSRPHGKLQDAYSLRCAPQVHGASRDALEHALRTALREANSTTDNPLVFDGGPNGVISAGHFHAEPLAMVFDYAAIAVAEIGSISERRTERLVNPDLSGLRPFLADDETKESGYMIVQVTAAALVAENRILCHPASVDTIPTSAGQEDHVSMGTHAARKLGQVVANATYVVASELLCAARALESLDDLRPGRGTAAAWEAVRDAAPRIAGDHPPAPELEALAELVSSGGLVAAVEEAAGPLEGIAPRKRRGTTSRRKR